MNNQHSEEPLAIDRPPDPAESPEEYADYLYDEVSGTLRDRAEPGQWARLSSRATKAELWEAIAAARAEFTACSAVVHADGAFQALHDWIMHGNPLPSPWRNHFMPRDEGSK